MITWNHAPYVAQAIESILSQECDFPFELLIGEDDSTDATRAICEEYAQRDPRVRLVTSDANVGMHANFRRLWELAGGKYVAFCEGDDYWSDPRKLAMQVTFLEAHPSFSMVGARTRKLRQAENGDWESAGVLEPRRAQARYSVEDLLPDYAFHFSSVLLRRDRVRLPAWLSRLYCVDRPLYLLCAQQGPVGFLPEEFSVYRLHPGGIWSPAAWEDKAHKGRELFRVLDCHFGGRYRRLIQRTLGGIIWSYMAEALAAGDRAVARRLYWMATPHLLAARQLAMVRPWLVVLTRLYLPGTYARLRQARGDS